MGTVGDVLTWRVGVPGVRLCGCRVGVGADRCLLVVTGHHWERVSSSFVVVVATWSEWLLCERGVWRRAVLLTGGRLGPVGLCFGDLGASSDGAVEEAAMVLVAVVLFACAQTMKFLHGRVVGHLA